MGAPEGEEVAPAAAAEVAEVAVAFREVGEAEVAPAV